MQILGIRTSIKAVRYAILESNGEGIVFTNADIENKLVFPAECQDISEKLLWLHREIERIFNQYPDISKIAIKSNEFFRESSSTRASTHLDAGVMLTSALHNKSVSKKSYSSIQKGLGSKKVKDYAEYNVCRTGKYWDNQMADAVAVAFTELEV